MLLFTKWTLNQSRCLLEMLAAAEAYRVPAWKDHRFLGFWIKLIKADAALEHS